MFNSKSSFNVNDMKVTEHFLSVPLNYTNESDDRKISIFFREVIALDRGNTNLPYLLYLQGGPGLASPRPITKTGWLSKALEHYKVILLDQRGTGMSSAITVNFLTSFNNSDDQVEYLTFFRADSIVKDCELIRNKLIGNSKWTLLGQSFGGFVILSYLSTFPDSIKAAIFTGGLAPVCQTAEKVYKKLAQRVINANKEYYRLFPQDIDKVKEIVKYLNENNVYFNGGGKLTADTFLQIGCELGRLNGYYILHYLINEAFYTYNNGIKIISNEFILKISNILSFDVYPLYAVLHECIYCNQTTSNWAASKIISTFKQFDYKKNLQTDEPIYLTGEMIFPHMFDNFSELSKIKNAAFTIAEKQNWSMLYDLEALKNCNVPCVAAVYYDDLYVEFEYSMETAELLPFCKTLISNQYFHTALGDDGYALMSKLLKMLKDNFYEKLS